MSTINTSRNNSSLKIKKLVMLALFCALAYATMFVFRIKVSFLTFDAKDAIITLSGLLFGPISSLIISFTVALIEMISVSDTGFYGFFMNFLSSATLSCTAALIYKYKKNIKGAIFGLVSAVFATSAIMVLFNLLITPLYLGTTTAAVATLVPKLLLPFNLTKSVLNSALVLILYKPVSRAMKAAKVIRHSDANINTSTAPQDVAVVSKKKKVLTDVIVFASGILLVVVSSLVFFLLLNGEFTIWENLFAK